MLIQKDGGTGFLVAGAFYHHWIILLLIWPYRLYKKAFNATDQQLQLVVKDLRTDLCCIGRC